MKVKKDQEVLVALYIDKSDRLCATMKVYPYLKTQSPYVVEDQVEEESMRSATISAYLWQLTISIPV